MADLLIREARLLATIDADRRELAGGWVAIDGGLITAVGASTDAEPAATETIDAADCLVTPGLSTRTTTCSRTSPAPTRR